MPNIYGSLGRRLDSYGQGFNAESRERPQGFDPFYLDQFSYAEPGESSPGGWSGPHVITTRDGRQVTQTGRGGNGAWEDPELGWVADITNPAFSQQHVGGPDWRMLAAVMAGGAGMAFMPELMAAGGGMGEMGGAAGLAGDESLGLSMGSSLAGDESLGLSMANPFETTGAFDVGGSAGFGGTTPLDAGGATAGAGTGAGTGAGGGAGTGAGGTSAGGGTTVPGTGSQSFMDSFISNASNNPLGLIRNALGIITGLNGAGALGNGMGSPGGFRNAADAAANRADPFGGHRAEVGDALARAWPGMVNPDMDAILNSAPARAEINAATLGSDRAFAAQGGLRSGNRMLATNDAAMTAAHKYAGDYMQRNLAGGNFMAMLSGANVNPATAAGLNLQGYGGAGAMQSQGLANLFSNGGPLSWLSGLFSGGGGGGGSSNANYNMDSLFPNGGGGIDWGLDSGLG